MTRKSPIFRFGCRWLISIRLVPAGGSIAWFERDGLMKVGPASAGAVPGPACYGRGGTEPTVSDANLILGRLAPGGLLGGTMALDTAAARIAFAPVAERLGFSTEENGAWRAGHRRRQYGAGDPRGLG